jgi:hypothetical protein
VKELFVYIRFTRTTTSTVAVTPAAGWTPEEIARALQEKKAEIEFHLDVGGFGGRIHANRTGERIADLTPGVIEEFNDSIVDIEPDQTA